MENFKLFFIYIYEEENLIKWVDLLEEDANEFTYLVFDLITDMLKENAKKIFFNILNNVEDVDFFDKIQQFFILFRFYDKISNNEEILKYVDTFQDNNKVSEFIKILKDINEEDYE